MNIGEIRSSAMVMSEKIYEMLDLIEQGFMENKAEFLSQAMSKESDLNIAEKHLAKSIAELSKVPANTAELSNLAQMIETLERMGDEAANLVERIEVKVAEKLLFSDEGVEQFNETYNAMRKSITLMIDFLRSKNASVKERVIDNGFHVKELVERYRRAQAERLAKGLCTPMGLNMYFDMLDFTGNLARHASTVVKLF